jgi:hypothetical protein
MRTLTQRENITLQIINTNPHGDMTHLAHNAKPTPKPKKKHPTKTKNIPKKKHKNLNR